VRVLDLSHVIAGPLASFYLAQLGAEVIKVEPPQGGEVMRSQPGFAALNSGKRSLAVDIHDASAAEAIRSLARGADVFIENYRSGVVKRYGLDYPSIRKVKPDIVYCSISGYGQRGRYARRGAFDVVVQAASGLMSVTGEADGPPVKCGVPVADFTAGLYAAYTILAARGDALREQRAIHLDCAMLDCLLGISALQTSEYWGTGVAPGRLGSAHPRNAPYQAFDASDAEIVIAAGNDELWRKVCEATGNEALLADPRFAGIAQRAKNQEALAAILQEAFSKRTAREWLDELERRGVPCGPMNTFADVLGDPELASTGLVQEMPVPVAGTTKTIAYPVQLDGNRVRASLPPPRLGEHSDDVYAQWTGKRFAGDGRAR
jgi:crotonobetainyl-CoA:carnitine CoA-transferase CaiB-like acyl-CoA transferase